MDGNFAIVFVFQQFNKEVPLPCAKIGLPDSNSWTRNEFQITQWVSSKNTIPIFFFFLSLQNQFSWLIVINTLAVSTLQLML